MQHAPVKWCKSFLLTSKYTQESTWLDEENKGKSVRTMWLVSTCRMFSPFAGVQLKTWEKKIAPWLKLTHIWDKKINKEGILHGGGRYEFYFRVAKQYFTNELGEWEKMFFANCVLTILELNWNQRFRDKKKKLNICHHMLTSSTQLQNRSFHVLERTRTSTKCIKNKKFTCKACKTIVFRCKIYFVTFLLPSS